MVFKVQCSSRGNSLRFARQSGRFRSLRNPKCGSAPGALWDILVFGEAVMQIASEESIEVIVPCPGADRAGSVVGEFGETLHTEHPGFVRLHRRNDCDVPVDAPQTRHAPCGEKTDQ